MPFLTLGNSDNVRVGDIVLAIGNPLGIGQTVTAGIISAKGRRTGLSDSSSFEDFLQTDAPINRGNSGGALVNLNGELIGINSQILSPGGANGGNIGIGFSIPSNMAKDVMEQLLKNGKVHRGMLGIFHSEHHRRHGQGPGIERYHRACSSAMCKRAAPPNKRASNEATSLPRSMARRSRTRTCFETKSPERRREPISRLRIVRDGQQQDVKAKLDEFDANAVTRSQNGGGDDNDAAPGKRKRKARTKPSARNAADRSSVEFDFDEGLVITDIDPTGPAAEAGLARGDVILEINKQAVTSVDEVKAVLDKAKNGPVLMLVARQGRTIYLTVRPG